MSVCEHGIFRFRLVLKFKCLCLCVLCGLKAHPILSYQEVLQLPLLSIFRLVRLGFGQESDYWLQPLRLMELIVVLLMDSWQENGACYFYHCHESQNDSQLRPTGAPGWWSSFTSLHSHFIS